MRTIDVHPPNDETPESWLEQFDSTPTLVPDSLPISDRMALVAVVVGPGGETIAFYVGDEETLAKISDPECPWALQRLFFTVPRTILQEPGVCPELAKDETG
jgi:hypothetical protein